MEFAAVVVGTVVVVVEVVVVVVVGSVVVIVVGVVVDVIVVVVVVGSVVVVVVGVVVVVVVVVVTSVAFPDVVVSSSVDMTVVLLFWQLASTKTQTLGSKMNSFMPIISQLFKKKKKQNVKVDNASVELARAFIVSIYSDVRMCLFAWTEVIRLFAQLFQRSRTLSRRTESTVVDYSFRRGQIFSFRHQTFQWCQNTPTSST